MINMDDVRYMSQTQKDNFLKNWEDAKPKTNWKIKHNTPMIYGTAGEIPDGNWENLFRSNE